MTPRRAFGLHSRGSSHYAMRSSHARRADRQTRSCRVGRVVIAHDVGISYVGHRLEINNSGAVSNIRWSG